MTLGQLGNLLEFTIHGWMHVRWTHTVYDAKTGEPIGREDFFDVDPRWDVPANDDLGDFYSSHVHPTFWRLHGWIDDRINDWATINAERITHTTVDDVPWFAADGGLVQVRDPFYWPSSGHHHHHHPEMNDSDIREMEEVLAIMKAVVVPPPTDAAAMARRTRLLQPAKLAFRDLILDVAIPPQIGES